jgi:beta-xylosidase
MNLSHSRTNTQDRLHKDVAAVNCNNPIIRHKFTADPTAIVHRNTLYLYTGRDEAPEGQAKYVMNEWLCFSSQDLCTWTEHTNILKPVDFPWASGDAYASKVIQHEKKFLWYVAVTHRTIAGKAIGVAASDNPDGPFTDAIGTALITTDMIGAPPDSKDNLDPTVIIDDGGFGHMYWGNSQCYYVRLKKNMTELDGPIHKIDLPGFTEGANIHRRNQWYYLSYGYGFPEKVAYAMSRKPEGPWEFKGILNEIPGNCMTNRPCIIEFKGRWYFIYHNGALPSGGSHRRSVCMEYLYYNEDDTIKRIIMTSEGVKAL